MALGRSRLGIVRPDKFAKGNAQPHQLLRSALLACYANGLTGTVGLAATNDPSPLRLFPGEHLTWLRHLLRERKVPEK